MSKSKYPNQIDTPSEIPIVRDNIFEIGSDAINSLRSAIIQIEKTLGINPQGAVGLTVGSRVSQSLDSSGNIRREALDIAGVVSGPIFDDQVSDVAAIKETKLRLDFPTKILQSEISYVSSLIDEIQKQIEEISAKLSAHLSPDAINRHPAKAISTTAIANTASSSGIREIGASNVQSVLEGIFSSHINYDGTDISSTNNSHSADQVYFDNSLTLDISSSDVQGAIEEVSGLLTGGVEKHQDLFHSNGFSRTAYILDKTNSSYGVLLSESSTASIYQNLGEKPYFEIILDTMITPPVEGVGIGDIIELTVNGLAKEYQIYQVQNDPTSGDITGFWLFGILFTTEVSIDTKIFLKRHRSYNSIGILASNRENYGLSSSSIIQIINPDAPFILSSGINPAEISSSNRYFDIKIDGTSYSFDAYSLAASAQSIDSIIKSINETVDQLGLPILAYRINLESGGSEIVIAGNISSSDNTTSSLEIVAVDSSLSSLGLSSFESKVIYGQPGASYYIDGKQYTGLLKKLDITGFDIEGGSRIISSGALGIDFTSYSIKKGDLVNIIDSDVKSYEVVSISSSYITLSSRQLPTGFSYSSVGTARVIIYEASINADALEFVSVGIVDGSVGVGSSLLEIFLDSNRILNLNLILEQESELFIDKSVYSIVDFYNPEGLTSVQINFENTTDGCVEVWLEDNQNRKKVVGDFNYLNLKSNIKNFNCDIYIQNKSSLYDYAASTGGSFSRKIYPSESINSENNLLIANVHYSNFLGKFDGGVNGALFIPKLNIGNLGEKDLSTEFKSTLLERPIREMRNSGFIFGLGVTEVSGLDGYTSGIYLITVSDGICYVDGKRFEILGGIAIDSGIDSSVYDKLYVGINSYGKIVFSPPDPDCLYPWEEESTLLIATIENDGVSLNIIDQRLFIDNLDLKLLNSILVSPQPGMGHFSNLPDAIKYAKRFSQIYTKAGTPEIHLKSGKHTVIKNITTESTLSDWQSNIALSGSNSDKTLFYDAIIDMGLAIDFPVSISGEGDGTELELKINLTTSDYADYEASAYLTVLGDGFNTTGTESTKIHGRFNSGIINFKNFKFIKGTFLFADLNIHDGATNLDFMVNINGINLETDFIRFVEASDSSSYKGNVLISNNKLYGGIIKIPIGIPNRLKNINISNNIFPIAATSGVFVGSNSTFPAENNIVYTGNISGDSSTIARKDRVAYDLFVPNDLTVEKNLSIGEALTASSFDFNSTKNVSKFYFANQIRDLIASNSFVSWILTDNYISSDPTSYFVRTVGTVGDKQVDWPTIRVENGVDTPGRAAIFYMPIVIDPGQNLKEVFFGLDGLTTWTLNIYNILLTGGSITNMIEPYFLVYGPSSNAIVPSPSDYRIESSSFTVNYTNESDSSEILLISMEHNEPDGVSKYIYYVKTTISQTSISSLIGAG